MNAVNPDNFNETLDGYKKYAVNFMREVLVEKGYSEEQLEEIERVLGNGFRWAKDELTMEDARNIALGIKKLHP